MDGTKWEKEPNTSEANELDAENLESAESNQESNQNLGSAALEVAEKTAETEDDDAEDENGAESEGRFESIESRIMGAIRPTVERYISCDLTDESHPYRRPVREFDLCDAIHDICKEISDEKPEEGVKSFEEYVNLLEHLVGNARRARRVYETDMAAKYVRLEDFDKEAGREKAIGIFDELVKNEREDPEKRLFGGISDWMEFRRMNNVPDELTDEDVILYHPDPDYHGAISRDVLERALREASKDLPFPYDERYYRPWNYSYRPSNFESAYRPGGYESSYRPGGYESSYRPGGYESYYRPGGYESYYRPGGYESSYRPRGYGEYRPLRFEPNYHPRRYDDYRPMSDYDNDIYRPGEY